VLASGPLKPSPSAFEWRSPPTQFSGLYQASGSAVFPVAYVVPCVRFNDVVRSLMSDVCVPGVFALPGSLKLLASLLQRRGFLSATVTPLPVLAASFITATLGTNGWLGLVRQGLSPCKKRQASLGALTVCVTGAGVGVDSAWEQKKLEAIKMLVKRAESHTSAARFVRRLS
jgi:hypothetical protein